MNTNNANLDYGMFYLRGETIPGRNGSPFTLKGLRENPSNVTLARDRLSAAQDVGQVTNARIVTNHPENQNGYPSVAISSGYVVFVPGAGYIIDTLNPAARNWWEDMLQWVFDQLGDLVDIWDVSFPDGPSVNEPGTTNPSLLSPWWQPSLRQWNIDKHVEIFNNRRLMTNFGAEEYLFVYSVAKGIHAARQDNCGFYEGPTGTGVRHGETWDSLYQGRLAALTVAGLDPDDLWMRVYEVHGDSVADLVSLDGINFDLFMEDVTDTAKLRATYFNNMSNLISEPSWSAHKAGFESYAPALVDTYFQWQNEVIVQEPEGDRVTSFGDYRITSTGAYRQTGVAEVVEPPPGPPPPDPIVDTNQKPYIEFEAQDWYAEQDPTCLKGEGILVKEKKPTMRWYHEDCVEIGRELCVPAGQVVAPACALCATMGKELDCEDLPGTARIVWCTTRPMDSKIYMAIQQGGPYTLVKSDSSKVQCHDFQIPILGIGTTHYFYVESQSEDCGTLQSIEYLFCVGSEFVLEVVGLNMTANLTTKTPKQVPETLDEFVTLPEETGEGPELVGLSGSASLDTQTPTQLAETAGEFSTEIDFTVA